MIRLAGIGVARLFRGGRLIQEVFSPNLVTDEGYNYAIDVWAGGATPQSSWYLVPLNVDHTPAASDTYANSMGTGYESTDYDETVRQAWIPGTVSGQSVDNSASKATYTMAGNDTSIFAIALVSNATKDDTDATGAILYSICSLSLAITGISDGDVLELQYTPSVSSAITDGFCIHNEALDNFLTAALCGGTQYETLYLAPLKSDYTQAMTDGYVDVMGTGSAESNDYSEADRPTWQCGAISAKTLTNSGNRATVTMAGNDASIYGHALVSSPTKGDATSGPLLFATCKYGAAKAITVPDLILKLTLAIGAGA